MHGSGEASVSLSSFKCMHRQCRGKEKMVKRYVFTEWCGECDAKVCE